LVTAGKLLIPFDCNVNGAVGSKDGQTSIVDIGGIGAVPA
jgi:hypothetical protein